MLKTYTTTSGAVVAYIASTLMLTACGSGGPPGKRGGDRGGQRGGPAQFEGRFGGTDFNALYRRTLAQVANEGCTDALSPLKSLAQQGPGYEGAQQALGECLLEMAPADATTGQLEALVWLRRAAEGGRAEAQGSLAAVYLDGPAALQNQSQALFWYALYRETASRHRVSFVPLDQTKEAKLEARFDAEALSSVANAVAAWQPAPWIPPNEMNMATPHGEQREPGDRDQPRPRRQPVEATIPVI